MSFDPHLWATGVGGKRESEAPFQGHARRLVENFKATSQSTLLQDFDVP
jgi:hypothetical protein